MDGALEAAAGQEGEVRALHLRLGEFSGVDADALGFAFEVAARDTPLAGARLEVKSVAASRELQLFALEMS